MRTILIATAAAGMFAAPALAYDTGSYGAETLSGPIGGIEDSHWFDYQTDVLEARNELESDLRDAHDEGDVYDAHAEYDRELADALYDYRKEALEAGLPVGRVRVGD